MLCIYNKTMLSRTTIVTHLLRGRQQIWWVNVKYYHIYIYYIHMRLGACCNSSVQHCEHCGDAKMFSGCHIYAGLRPYPKSKTQLVTHVNCNHTSIKANATSSTHFIYYIVLFADDGFATTSATYQRDSRVTTKKSNVHKKTHINLALISNAC